MKKHIYVALLLIGSFSCKVSDSITIDSMAKKENFKDYQTFKMVESESWSKKNLALTEVFQERLIEFGFEQKDENPDFLIQAVLVNREFIQQLGSYSSAPLPLVYTPSGYVSGGSSEFVINKGMIGKVIFLIQDAKSYEIAWMGIGTGIVSSGSRFDQEKLSLALDELVATID